MPRKIGASTYSENFQGSDYTDDEFEFLKAIAAYQKRWRRRYPSWREVLFVLRCLGYRKVAAPQPFADPLPGEVELLKTAKSEAKSA
jgi:hypothetical protein